MYDGVKAMIEAEKALRPPKPVEIKPEVVPEPVVVVPEPEPVVVVKEPVVDV